jgi:hypothetical protein
MTDSIEDLLAQTKAKYGNHSPPAPLPGKETDDRAIANLLAKLQASPETPAQPEPESTLQQELQAIRAEAAPPSAPNPWEQQRQAILARQRRAEIVRRAEAWLRTLNPQDGESAWFEEFATKYESRVEAAIDYLGLS